MGGGVHERGAGLEVWITTCPQGGGVEWGMGWRRVGGRVEIMYVVIRWSVRKVWSVRGAWGGRRRLRGMGDNVESMRIDGDEGGRRVGGGEATVRWAGLSWREGVVAGYSWGRGGQALRIQK